MQDMWSKLPVPFFVQAPMEDVTDVAFRTVITRHGKPDVMFTEFTSADGLVRADERGKRTLLKKLEFGEGERPIVAQLFSGNPAYMEEAAALVQELGFDGLDINMGCPVNEVVRQGCGSALIKEPEKAKELIRAAKRGAPHLPISVKTRIGYAGNELATWVPALLEEGLAALTIHARTRNEMSAVPARWEHIKETVEIRDRIGVNTVIVGNGDVVDLNDARTKATESGCDGVMLGRAIYGNPWLYADRPHPPTKEERIAALIEHLGVFDEMLTGFTNFALMKKHFKAYVSGWDGAKELRVKLMETSSVSEAVLMLHESLRR